MFPLGFLDDRPLAVTIYHFPIAAMTGDVDNIVKLIIDGMIAIAYLDDSVVERVTVQKFEPEIDWSFSPPDGPTGTRLGPGASRRIHPSGG